MGQVQSPIGLLVRCQKLRSDLEKQQDWTMTAEMMGAAVTGLKRLNRHRHQEVWVNHRWVDGRVFSLVK